MKIWHNCQWSVVSMIIGILIISQSIIAQNDREILADLVKEEQEAVNAIVLYPEETRMAILNASLYPEALIKMESIQSKTRASFVELIEDYPQEVQEGIWDLSRYPNLINTLVNTSKAAIDNDLVGYPSIIHKRAKKAFASYFELLSQVDELDFAAESAYSSILEPYPEEIQNALNHLLGQPEVLTILMDNIRLTILLGKVYEQDPEWLLHKADSLHLQLAADNARELADWKQSLEEDPESIEQMREVSEMYKEEHNYYDDEYYAYDQRVDDVTVHYYYEYNYPYWFGYPSWYAYPRWRMHPYWYDWGFYYGPLQTIIILGLPSFHFTYWYFGQPQHHHQYSHLSTHFANHYYGHRNSTGSVTSGVTRWRNNNREVVSERWMKDDGKLNERFQEFGRAEVKRSEYNMNHPEQEVSQRDFISKNSQQFPSLAKAVDQVIDERKDIRTVRKNTQDDRPQTQMPVVTERKTEKNRVNTVPKKQDTEQTKISRREVTEQRTNTIPNTTRAKDFHKSTWENSTTTPTKVERPRTPVRKPPVTKVPVTKKTTKKTTPVKKKPNGN